jgi:hypothetical protein
VRDVSAVHRDDVKHEDTPEEVVKAYLEYNRILRTWFVAFGIGGPALFLAKPEIAQRLLDGGRQLRHVALLFLIGAGCQVVGAFVNKCANWTVYFGLIDEPFTGSWSYQVGLWLVEQFWIDFILDLATLGTFGYAVWLMLTLFGGTS